MNTASSSWLSLDPDSGSRRVKIQNCRSPQPASRREKPHDVVRFGSSASTNRPIPRFHPGHRGANLPSVQLQHHPSQHLPPEHSDQCQRHLEISRISLLRKMRGDGNNGKCVYPVKRAERPIGAVPIGKFSRGNFVFPLRQS